MLKNDNDFNKSQNDLNTKTHVSVAVIHGKDGRILITKRLKGQHMEELWEFPGGKLEEGESAEMALGRELDEELGIVPVVFEPLISIEHSYPQKTVVLHVFTVTVFQGAPEARERQPMVWAKKENLRDYAFPPANQSIVSAVLLPDKYAITGSFADSYALFEKVGKQLNDGIRLIQFRANELPENQYIEHAKELSQICSRYDATLMIKGDPEFLEYDWCQGLHLRSKMAMKLYQRGWKRDSKKYKAKWLAVSCHNLHEINVAKAIGADFVTLSPVCLTQCHPERIPLGFSLAADITSRSSLPVYWLGGLSLRNKDRAHSARAQGIAAISAFWPE